MLHCNHQAPCCLVRLPAFRASGVVVVNGGVGGFSQAVMVIMPCCVQILGETRSGVHLPDHSAASRGVRQLQAEPTHALQPP